MSAQESARAQTGFAPQRTAESRYGQLRGAILAGAGLLGLGCTLLPLVTITATPDTLIDVVSDVTGDDLQSIRSSAATASFSFYDFYSSQWLVAAAIPLALILALFTGGAMLAGFSTRRLVPLSAIASVIALVLLAITTIRPITGISGSLDGTVVDISEQGLLDWSFGPGLYIAMAMVLVSAAVALWSHYRRD